MNKITKEQIALHLKDKIGLSSVICSEIVDNFFSEILKLTKQDQKLVLQKFGTFAIRHKKQRPGRNLRKKESITIPARTVMSFSPSTNLKASVNQSEIR
jgi:integration host factor subunit alpha